MNGYVRSVRFTTFNRPNLIVLESSRELLALSQNRNISYFQLHAFKIARCFKIATPIKTRAKLKQQSPISQIISTFFIPLKFLRILDNQHHHRAKLGNVHKRPGRSSSEPPRPISSATAAAMVPVAPLHRETSDSTTISYSRELHSTGDSENPTHKNTPRISIMRFVDRYTQTHTLRRMMYAYVCMQVYVIWVCGMVRS